MTAVEEGDVEVGFLSVVMTIQFGIRNLVFITASLILFSFHHPQISKIHHPQISKRMKFKALFAVMF